MIARKSAVPAALRVLVVDDIAANVKLLEGLLRQLGHQVLVARSGEEAIESYQRDDPDLIFMDVMMPGIGGLEAVRRIRALPTDKWTPIVFLSALDTLDDIMRGLDLGGDDYLVKPADLQLLRAKINGYARAIAMQAQLRANALELAEWRAESEAQSRLGHHVISRLVDAVGLRDPMLKWLNIPAQTFSGDLLCSARAPGDILYIMLADAAGHGLAAALSVLPLTQIFYGMTAKGFPLASIVEEMNRRLKAIMPADRFVAATLAAIDVRSQTVEVWNGGTPDALLLNPAGEVAMRWVSRHPPLGVLPPDLFSGTTETLHFEEAGELVLYSDGLVEMATPDRPHLGMDGLEALLRGTAPGERFRALETELGQLLAIGGNHDDISLMVVKTPLERRQGVRLTPLREEGEGVARRGPVSEWRLELSWGAEELRHLDVVPAVLGLLNQIEALKPHQGALFLILSELYNNALDHGLLGLDSAIKNDPGGFEQYLRQREERLGSLNSGRIDMELHLRMDGEAPVLDIRFSDTGPGFDYRRYTRPAQEVEQVAHHGRGIHLVRNLCAKLTYSGTGNRVFARYRL